MPSNVVSYYQQIGRAGRNIDRAYIFLMHGKEDKDILNYFINTAFPTEQETSRIVELISKFDGVGQGRLISELNIRKSRIEKALAFLQNDGFIRKEQSNTLRPSGLSMRESDFMPSGRCQKKRRSRWKSSPRQRSASVGSSFPVLTIPRQMTVDIAPIVWDITCFQLMYPRRLSIKQKPISINW